MLARYRPRYLPAIVRRHPAGRLSVAAKKGAIVAVEKGPVVGLRYGLRQAQEWGSSRLLLFSGRLVRAFGLVGTIGLACDLEDDRSFD